MKCYKIFLFLIILSTSYLQSDQLTIEGDLIVTGSVSAPEIILDGEILQNPKNLNEHRGANLFTNGFGTMGNTYNFSNASYDPHDKAVGEGSFLFAGFQASTRMEEFIPAEAGALYSLSFYARSASFDPNNRARLMIECYDVDKNIIHMEHIGYYLNSITSLASPLEDGDMEIHLVDVSGFVENRPYYDRALVFWNYTNSLGYTYPAGSYSRNISQVRPEGLWETVGGIDYVNNTITLIAPWPKARFGEHPAGTVVSQVRDGSTNIYPMPEMSGSVVPEEWTYYHCTFRASRPGTAFFKVALQVNLNSATNVTKLSGITLEKVPMISGPLGDISMGEFQ